MKIVFYCTNPNKFDSSTFCMTHFPSNAELINNLAASYPEIKIVLAYSLPAIFIADYKDSVTENQYINQNHNCVDKIIFDEHDSVDEITEKLLSVKPDIAIPVSYWTSPFDWLSTLDSLVAEKLEEKGIKTLACSVNTSLLCFDKAQTKAFLKGNGFNTADYVYVNHDHYFRTNRSIKLNVYRESILQEIKKLNFPVIIKDTTGASSIGLDVMNSFDDVKNYLDSRRNNSDRIIEEFLTGQQFGIEIESSGTFHSVLPPFIFSVNKFGITSPKQSVKIGPVTGKYFCTDKLQTEMKRLAELLEFKGIVQIDLVFHNSEWYIIEINPRLSGMTRTYASSRNKSVPETLINLAVENYTDRIKSTQTFSPCLNIKLPIVNEEKLLQIKDFPGVCYVCQTENKKASQIRERGYTEIIFRADSFSELSSVLERFNDRFSDIMESVFLENARKLFSEINKSI